MFTSSSDLIAHFYLWNLAACTWWLRRLQEWKEVCLCIPEGAVQRTHNQGSRLKNGFEIWPQNLLNHNTTRHRNSYYLVRSFHIIGPNLCVLSEFFGNLQTRDLRAGCWPLQCPAQILVYWCPNLASRSVSLLLPLQCDKATPRKLFRWWLFLLIINQIQFWGDLSEMSLVWWWQGYHQGKGTWQRSL